jgi:hypothetical protein
MLHTLLQGDAMLLILELLTALLAVFGGYALIRLLWSGRIDDRPGPCGRARGCDTPCPHRTERG